VAAWRATEGKTALSERSRGIEGKNAFQRDYARRLCGRSRGAGRAAGARSLERFHSASSGATFVFAADDSNLLASGAARVLAAPRRA